MIAFNHWNAKKSPEGFAFRALFCIRRYHAIRIWQGALTFRHTRHVFNTSSNASFSPFAARISKLQSRFRYILHRSSSMINFCNASNISMLHTELSICAVEYVPFSSIANPKISLACVFSALLMTSATKWLGMNKTPLSVPITISPGRHTPCPIRQGAL